MFTNERYKIEAVLGMRVYANQITRNEAKITYHLGTPQGVASWVRDNSPFISLRITDLTTKQDVTAEFTEGIQLCKSRYQGGFTFMNIRGI